MAGLLGIVKVGGIPKTPHLLHVFPSFMPGGYELRTVQLIHLLGSRFRHSILSLDGQRAGASRLQPDADARVLEAQVSGGMLGIVVQLRRLFRTMEPDLVLTYNWGSFNALIAALSLGSLPMIHHEDGFNADEAVRFKKRRVVARRFALRGVARVVVPSRRLLRIARELWKVPQSRIELIPNGISVSKYQGRGNRSRIRPEISIPSEALVVGTVGQLRPVKNLFRLIDAVARMDLPDRECHLLIVGDGSMRAQLEEHARRAKLFTRTHFVGYQPDISPFLEAMDVFALSSDSEQMPVSLLEAMAAGLPVVATNVGDVQAILPDLQRPYLVSLEDADPTREFSRQLQAILEDPSNRRILGGENRRHVSNCYGERRMATAYEQMYLEVMGGSSEPREDEP